MFLLCALISSIFIHLLPQTVLSEDFCTVHRAGGFGDLDRFHFQIEDGRLPPDWDCKENYFQWSQNLKEKCEVVKTSLTCPTNTTFIGNFTNKITDCPGIPYVFHMYFGKPLYCKSEDIEPTCQDMCNTAMDWVIGNGTDFPISWPETQNPLSSANQTQGFEYGNDGNNYGLNDGDESEVEDETEGEHDVGNESEVEYDNNGEDDIEDEDESINENVKGDQKTDGNDTKNETETETQESNANNTTASITTLMAPVPTDTIPNITAQNDTQNQTKQEIDLVIKIQPKPPAKLRRRRYIKHPTLKTKSNKKKESTEPKPKPKPKNTEPPPSYPINPDITRDGFLSKEEFVLNCLRDCRSRKACRSNCVSDPPHDVDWSHDKENMENAGFLRSTVPTCLNTCNDMKVFGVDVFEFGGRESS